jgi:hypothetical protein
MALAVEREVDRSDGCAALHPGRSGVQVRRLLGSAESVLEEDQWEGAVAVRRCEQAAGNAVAPTAELEALAAGIGKAVRWLAGGDARSEGLAWIDFEEGGRHRPDATAPAAHLRHRPVLIEVLHFFRGQTELLLGESAAEGAAFDGLGVRLIPLGHVE